MNYVVNFFKVLTYKRQPKNP